MDTFSISQLSQFSGIKAHTIRIWEQRYNALKPDRSEGNTRYYNNSQLRRLLNIVSLSENGYKVSELCSMPDRSLFKLIGEVNAGLHSTYRPNNSPGYYVSQLIAAGMRYDETHFEKILSHSLMQYGMKDTYTMVIYPMLIRLGLMWSSDTLPLAYEHFISNLLKQKIFTAINSLPPAKHDLDSWLLFLPENEFHEIGLLFSYYLVRLSGGKVIYLGSNVPLQSVETSITQIKPDYLLFFLVHNELPEKIEWYCDQLTKFFNGKRIYLAAEHKMIAGVKISKKISLLSSVETLEQKLSFV